jgi:hypothetical protein
LAERLVDRHQQAGQDAERAGAGAVAERRIAEVLRARAADPDPAAGRQGPDVPLAEPAEQGRDRPRQERDREPEDDFGDSWHTYRERAERIRQTYSWRVPKPPHAESWLPLGRDDQEHDQPPDRSRRWQGEERNYDREDR